MANKKLKVEVELETEKAKRKLGQMGDGTSAPSPTPSSRSADRLAEATQLNTKQMLSMTRAFSGMAIGLAASYSSRYFTQGSTAEKILGYGGAAVAGASAGAMMGAPAGPVGMAVGGLAGAGIAVGKEYLDRDKAINDAIDEYAVAEGVLEENEEFKNALKRITSSFNTDSLGKKLNDLNVMYTDYLEAIEQLKKEIEEDLVNGNLGNDLKRNMDKLGRARGYKDAILSVAEKMDGSANGPRRASLSATDALMKIGGGFGLPTADARSNGIVEAIIADGVTYTNRLLEDIRANTGKKGGSWL